MRVRLRQPQQLQSASLARPDEIAPAVIREFATDPLDLDDLAGAIRHLLEEPASAPAESQTETSPNFFSQPIKGCRRTGERSAHIPGGTPFSAIDAFCGAGGLSYGLELAGFQMLAAFDNNEPAIETYRANLTGVGFVADARTLTAEVLMEKAGSPAHVDLLAGGPPCQGFSKQKRSAHNGDERNDLVLEYVRLVRDIGPRFFMLENVAQLVGKRGKSFLSELRGELASYTLFPELFNSADFGVAQTRCRFIIVGKRNDIGSEYHGPKRAVGNWLTVGEAFKGLPEPPVDYTEHPDYVNHYVAKVSGKNIERFSHVPPGGGWEDIPYALRQECHQKVDRSKGGWPDAYGRLKADGQAPTITGGFDSFTRGRYGHPFADRPITPREAAGLQGFPDWFRFHGTKWDIRHQIGNAVPCPLSQALGESIRRTLQAEDTESSAAAGFNSLVSQWCVTPSSASSSSSSVIDRSEL